MKTKEELEKEALKPYKPFFNFDLQWKMFGGLASERLKEIPTEPVSLKSVLEKIFLAGYEAGQPKWTALSIFENRPSQYLALSRVGKIQSIDSEETPDSWVFEHCTHWMPLPTLPKDEENE